MCFRATDVKFTLIIVRKMSIMDFLLACRTHSRDQLNCTTRMNQARVHALANTTRLKHFFRNLLFSKSCDFEMVNIDESKSSVWPVCLSVCLSVHCQLGISNQSSDSYNI